MATELVPFAAQGGVPAEWNFLDPNQDNLADGIAGSYGLIGYKGKTLTLKYQGSISYFTDPRNNMPAQYLHFVIIGSAPNKSKSYFEHYVEGALDPPLCTSMDGIVPDVGVQAKQADVCALCPRAQWYPNPEMPGKKKRDCNEYKRLAVLLMYSDTQRMLGAPLAEPVFLRVPAASLQNLAALGNELARKGFHFARVVTRMTFDPAAAFPKMVFQAVQEVPANMAGVIREMMEDQLTQRILGLDTAAGALAAPQTQQQLPPATGFDVGPGVAGGAAGGPAMTAPAPPPAHGVVAPQGPVRVATVSQAVGGQGGGGTAPPATVLDLTAIPAAHVGQGGNVGAPPMPDMAIPADGSIPGFLQRPQPAPPAGQPPLTGASTAPAAPPPNPPAMQPMQAPVGDTGEPAATTAEIDAIVAKFMPK